jgi:copper chaperone
VRGVTTTTTLSVPEIHCGNCKSSIEGALGGLAGIESAEVSVDDRTVTVAFDDATVGLDVIRTTIEEQGFDVA